MRKMNNKAALIIGGSGGIGAEIARQMADKGIKVYSSYYNGQTAPQQASVSSFPIDVTDSLSVQNALSKILKERQIDIVVFSATAPVENKPFMTIQWEDYAKHMDVQIKGLFNIVSALKGQLKSKYKTKFIIILTEYCAGKPPASLSHYITAKYALWGLAKSMAVELARYNCTVNMISPGMTDTRLISNLPSKLIEITAERNLLGRIAKPLDVARVVLFLASDESEYLNGTNIFVNGGEVMV